MVPVTWARDDPGVVGHWLLRGATATARLFLPLEDARTGAVVTWAQVLARVEPQGRPQLEGGMSFSRVAEYPGGGGELALDSVDTAHGIIPATLLDVLEAAMAAHVGSAAAWCTQRVAPLGAGAQGLPWPREPVAEDAGTGDAGLTTRFTDLAAHWRASVFPGRAWSVGGRAALAAPAYADSVFVSGTRGLLADLERRGAELAGVGPDQPLPDLST